MDGPVQPEGQGLRDEGAETSPRFSANLSFLWPELDMYDRPRAAADAGFGAVEILFPHELDEDRLAAALNVARVDLVLFDVPPGDRTAGERGMLCIPGREDECLSAVKEALRMAERFGTRRLNVLAGVMPAGLTRDVALRQAVETLRRAGDMASRAGVELLIENLNPVAAPGYLTSTVDEAAELVRQANHRAIGLQFDQYHVSMVGGDPVALFAAHASLVRHIQIADAPDRHQPGTGGAEIAGFLDHLDASGYEGYVGLEYNPVGGMSEALAWLPLEARQ